MLLLFMTTLPVLAGEGASLSSEHSAFFGRAKRQQYLPGLTMAGCSEPNVICADVYYRWTIVVDQHISGPALPRVVQAVMLQHTMRVLAKKQVALYVLSKIVDPEKRSLFGADYYIQEYSPPRVIYCLSAKDEDYGLGKTESVFPSVAPGCYTR